MGSPSAASKPAEMMTRSGANSAGSGWGGADVLSSERQPRHGQRGAQHRSLHGGRRAPPPHATPQAVETNSPAKKTNKPTASCSPLLTVGDGQHHVLEGGQVVPVAHAAAGPGHVDGVAGAWPLPHLVRRTSAGVEGAASSRWSRWCGVGERWQDEGQFAAVAAECPAAGRQQHGLPAALGKRLAPHPS